MSLRTILSNIKVRYTFVLKYELICKRRGYHEPITFDRLEFEDDTRFHKYTLCIDCKVELVLQPDLDSTDEYFVDEC